VEDDIKIVRKKESSVTDEITRSISSSRDDILLCHYIFFVAEDSFLGVDT
jgi:hypothetical protein